MIRGGLGGMVATSTAATLMTPSNPMKAQVFARADMRIVLEGVFKKVNHKPNQFSS